MVEQRAQARLVGSNEDGEAHGGGSESGSHYRTRLPATRELPLTRVRCPAAAARPMDNLAPAGHRNGSFSDAAGRRAPLVGEPSDAGAVGRSARARAGPH